MIWMQFAEGMETVLNVQWCYKSLYIFIYIERDVNASVQKSRWFHVYVSVLALLGNGGKFSGGFDINVLQEVQQTGMPN